MPFLTHKYAHELTCNAITRREPDGGPSARGRGVRVGPGRYVEITDEEAELLAPFNNGIWQILAERPPDVPTVKKTLAEVQAASFPGRGHG